MVEVASSKNATLGAFSPPQQSEGARRVQSPEAMAIEGNLTGLIFYLTRADRPAPVRSLSSLKHQYWNGLGSHPMPVDPGKL